MYDYENSTQNPDGAASGSGSNTDSGAGAGISAGSGGEYRYSGPFYQDDLSGSGSGSTGGRASSGYSYSYESGGYSGGSYRKRRALGRRWQRPSALRWYLALWRERLFRGRIIWDGGFLGTR